MPYFTMKQFQRVLVDERVLLHLESAKVWAMKVMSSINDAIKTQDRVERIKRKKKK